MKIAIILLHAEYELICPNFYVNCMLRLYYISLFKDDTFGRKISAKNIVVRMNIPATNIPVPMLMYVLRENVTSASTTITILEM